MMSRAPVVNYCNVHLQDKQDVQFHHNDTHAERVEAARHITSDLLKYFGRPQPSDFDHLTLLHSTMKNRPLADEVDKNVNTVLKYRGISSTNHIARIAIDTPDEGDVFYLRLLLYNKASRTFEQLRTVNGTSFEKAAIAMGIVTGNEE
ncbi:unnamed protein product [Ascophyllum nodosum]